MVTIMVTKMVTKMACIIVIILVSILNRKSAGDAKTAKKLQALSGCCFKPPIGESGIFKVCSVCCFARAFVLFGLLLGCFVVLFVES